MEEKLLKDVKPGEWFTLKRPADENYVPDNLVWVRDAYDHSERKYECYKWSDMNHWSLKKGTCKVWVGFTF